MRWKSCSRSGHNWDGIDEEWMDGRAMATARDFLNTHCSFCERSSLLPKTRGRLVQESVRSNNDADLPRARQRNAGRFQR